MKLLNLISLVLCVASFGAGLVRGDLNGDGVLDQAEIVWTEGNKNPPDLIITLKKKDGTDQKIKSPKAICLGCGGPKAIMDYPLGELSIIKGILVITYEGGARSVWKDVFRWRLDSSKKNLVLIGRTYEIEDNFGEYAKEKVDANYSTGKIDRTIGKKKKSCSFDSSKKIYLSKYDFAEDRTDDLEKLEKACLMKKGVNASEGST